MRSARVTFELPSGEQASVGPGALVGRAWTAEVRVSDFRVSEAHAWVSLREAGLQVLPLRGRVRLDGRDVQRVDLAAGQRIELAPGLALSVVEVVLPDELLAVSIDGGAAQVATGTMSLMLEPGPHLRAGIESQAAAILWADGASWFLQAPGGPPQLLEGGAPLTVGSARVTAAYVPTSAASVPDTLSRMTQTARLHLKSFYDSVHVWDDERPPLVLRGLAARLVSELIALGGPAHWSVVAAELWADTEDRDVLRHRLDVTTAKVRRLLGEAGFRRDLVTSHNTGQLELLMYPGDRVEVAG
ncbi:MAG: hypothetical protein SFW67_30725 [Myxococcaceae bacterium]|nr:hypothetical protein [Myxococcaceae bacterium]